MDTNMPAKVENFYVSYRLSHLSHADDKSWNTFYCELCQVFPECNFQLIMNDKLMVIRCTYDREHLYFKCKYDDPNYIKMIGEEEAIRNAI